MRRRNVHNTDRRGCGLMPNDGTLDALDVCLLFNATRTFCEDTVIFESGFFMYVLRILGSRTDMTTRIDNGSERTGGGAVRYVRARQIIFPLRRWSSGRRCICFFGVKTWVKK